MRPISRRRLRGQSPRAGGSARRSIRCSSARPRSSTDVLWGLVAGGHVLLEGAPGLGKTLLVRTLASLPRSARSRASSSRRTSCRATSTGTNVLVTAADGTRHFALHKGPIFGQVILADEINRATPKTQSALLEAMQEHACTIAGTRHALEEPFFVLATENPIEMEGTYPLPEAQLDRFLLKVIVPSPSEDEMTEILARTTGRERGEPPRACSRATSCSTLRALCRDVAVAEPVLRYASRLVRASDPSATARPTGEARAALRRRRARRAVAGARGQGGRAARRARARLVRRRRSASPSPCCATASSARFEGEADGITTDQVVDALLEAVPTRPEAVASAAIRGSKRGGRRERPCSRCRPLRRRRCAPPRRPRRLCAVPDPACRRAQPVVFGHAAIVAGGTRSASASRTRRARRSTGKIEVVAANCTAAGPQELRRPRPFASAPGAIGVAPRAGR